MVLSIRSRREGRSRRLTASEQRTCGTWEQTSSCRLRRGVIFFESCAWYRHACLTSEAAVPCLGSVSPLLVTTRRWVSPSSHIASSRIFAPLPLLAQSPPTLSIHTDTPPSSPASTLFLPGFSRTGHSPWNPYLKLNLPLLTRWRCRSQSRKALACQGTASVADCRGTRLVGGRGQCEVYVGGRIV